MALTPITNGMSGSAARAAINTCFTKVDTVETGADVTDLTNVGVALASSSAKGTIVDADLLNIQDSAASYAPKTTLWSLVKSTLKAYFDGVYQTIGTLKSATTVITIGAATAPTSGQVLTAASSTEANWQTPSSGGGIMPIQATKTDAFSTTSANGVWADVTGLSVVITPTTSAKRVLVELVLFLANNGAAGVGFQAVRGSTPLLVGDVTGLQTAVGGAALGPNNYYPQTVAWSYVDSPATTSATTYKVQITGLSSGGVTSYVNRNADNSNNSYTSHGSSMIRVTEVN